MASEPLPRTVEHCPECDTAWEADSVSVNAGEPFLDLVCANGHHGAVGLSGGPADLASSQSAARPDCCRLWRGPLDGAVIPGAPQGNVVYTEAGHCYRFVREDPDAWVFEFAPEGQDQPPAPSPRRRPWPWRRP